MQSLSALVVHILISLQLVYLFLRKSTYVLAHLAKGHMRHCNTAASVCRLSFTIEKKCYSS